MAALVYENDFVFNCLLLIDDTLVVRWVFRLAFISIVNEASPQYPFISTGRF